MNSKLMIAKDRIADFCRRHYIRRLAIFGSALRDDFGPDSNVDVLVDFVPGHTPGLFGMEEQFSPLLGGRKVEIRTPQDLSRYFRQEVVTAAKVQYVQE